MQSSMKKLGDRILTFGYLKPRKSCWTKWSVTKIRCDLSKYYKMKRIKKQQTYDIEKLDWKQSSIIYMIPPTAAYDS